ncbi:MAG: hypothetical protein ACLSHU_05305 [Oscillospiraceae bacterium]
MHRLRICCWIDGGITHAETARRALEALELDFPVFGMVKDGKHRTRALVTPEGREIALDGTPAVFALIGTIQEETHRFAITTTGSSKQSACATPSWTRFGRGTKREVSCRCAGSSL